MAQILGQKHISYYVTKDGITVNVNSPKALNFIVGHELTADLVGDYIFSDKDFVNNLAKNHRNVFDKLFDEIKRLWRLATAGSKEKRQLEKAKNLFEDAIREVSNTDAKVEKTPQIKAVRGILSTSSRTVSGL